MYATNNAINPQNLFLRRKNKQNSPQKTSSQIPCKLNNWISLTTTKRFLTPTKIIHQKSQSQTIQPRLYSRTLNIKPRIKANSQIGKYLNESTSSQRKIRNFSLVNPTIKKDQMKPFNYLSIVFQNKCIDKKIEKIKSTKKEKKRVREKDMRKVGMKGLKVQNFSIEGYSFK